MNDFLMQLGETAFKYAAKYGRIDCMRLLAERGADMHVQDIVRDNVQCNSSIVSFVVFIFSSACICVHHSVVSARI